MSKGSTPRPVADPETFRDEYERIFEKGSHGLLLVRDNSDDATPIREIIERMRATILAERINRDSQDG